MRFIVFYFIEILTPTLYLIESALGQYSPINTLRICKSAIVNKAHSYFFCSDYRFLSYPLLSSASVIIIIWQNYLNQFISSLKSFFMYFQESSLLADDETSLFRRVLSTIGSFVSPSPTEEQAVIEIVDRYFAESMSIIKGIALSVSFFLLTNKIWKLFHGVYQYFFGWAYGQFHNT